MKKNIKLIISTISLASISIVATSTLTACSNTTAENINETYSYKIDAFKIPALNKYTATEWQNIIVSGETTLINQLLAEISKEINTVSKPTILIELNKDNSYFKNIFSQKYDNANPTRASLVVEVVHRQTLIKVEIKNLFIFANSNFVPPKQTTYTFNQLDLSTIKNISYLNITNAQWTNAFNATTNGINFVIPPTGYCVKNKTYKAPTGVDNKYGQYVIVYGIANDYSEQISTLVNAASFRDITITVNLSPYIGKILQTSFVLGQAEINAAFGPNSTIQTVQGLTPIQVYSKLKDYVDTLTTIQPLRDCINLTNSTEVDGYSIVHSILNTNQLIIKFRSNNSYIENFNYSFVLNFTK